MPAIPNFPPSLLDEHMKWHMNVGDPAHGGRSVQAGTSGSGIEFLAFHRSFIQRVLGWYQLQPGADLAAIAPWTAIPPELKVPRARWTAVTEDQERRILTNNPSFQDADDLGIFIETGIHNNFLHGAASVIYNEPVLNDPHQSPLSTYFYRIHGLVDKWWSDWVAMTQVSSTFARLSAPLSDRLASTGEETAASRNELLASRTSSKEVLGTGGMADGRMILALAHLETRIAWLEARLGSESPNNQTANFVMPSVVEENAIQHLIGATAEATAGGTLNSADLIVELPSTGLVKKVAMGLTPTGRGASLEISQSGTYKVSIEINASESTEWKGGTTLDENDSATSDVRQADSNNFDRWTTFLTVS